MLSGDLWQQQEFEDHVASMLVSLYETSIKGDARNNPIKAARLSVAHLVQARVIGPYIPGKDRQVWAHGFDVQNDAFREPPVSRLQERRVIITGIWP